MTGDVVLYFVISKMFLGEVRNRGPGLPPALLGSLQALYSRYPMQFRLVRSGCKRTARCWASAAVRQPQAPEAREAEGQKDLRTPGGPRQHCILSGGRPGAWHGQPRSGAACSTVFKGGGVPGRPPLSFLKILGFRRTALGNVSRTLGTSRNINALRGEPWMPHKS